MLKTSLLKWVMTRSRVTASVLLWLCPRLMKSPSRRLPWLHLAGLWCSMCRAGMFRALLWVCLGQSSLMERFRNWILFNWGYWWHCSRCGWLKESLFVPQQYQNPAECVCESWWRRTVSAKPCQAAAVHWGEHLCRGAGDHCSGCEGWAARPVVLLSLPCDLFTRNAGKCWMW